MIARLDDLRAKRLGHVTRTRDDLLRDLRAACVSLGEVADRGVTEADLAGIGRTAEGIRRVLAGLQGGRAA